MRILGNRSLVPVFSLALIGAGLLWAGSSPAEKPERPTLPKSGLQGACPIQLDEAEGEDKTVALVGAGTFTEKSTGARTQIMAEVGERYISKEGLATVPLKISTIGGYGFAEGVGQTHFWLDTTRPVMSAIWEKRPGTEFPAIQEMRFHFFYTVEAMPDKIFRSVNPARMRSDDVRAFPPRPGTVYRLVEPVDLEEIHEPGIVVRQVLRNRVVIPEVKPQSFDRDFN